ncbi:MAG: hypothetical protein AAFX79_07965 [Planctomycetota bacterium]
MTARSTKPNALASNLSLTTASAAALGAAGHTPVTLAQAGDAFSIEKTPQMTAVGTEATPSDEAALPNNGEITVDEHLIVDLHVVDEDLADVLQLLSIQSQRNIVASNSVSATVTATLYGVTFYEALDAILHVNGFGYIEEGNFIYVYTAEEIQRIIDTSRKRSSAVIPLDYLNPTDAAEFAQALLSESGQIKAPGRTAPFQIPDNAPVGADDLATESFIVVVDFDSNIEEIRNLLTQIDTKPSQVLVEATILQAALNEANAFGVDFSIIGSLNFGDFLGGPLDAVDTLISGRSEDEFGTPILVPGEANQPGGAITSTAGQTSKGGTLKLGYVDGDFAAFLRVLDEVTDTTIIARPKVLTLNRQPARVLVGERVGYLSSTTTETGTTQTVEFLDTGTQLYFRPFVSRDGLIRMELKPQVSEAVIRDATDTGGSTVTIPDETTNELTANVMVRDGQTIVLGGLFRERTQYTRRQVPYIGDLPFIGAAFRGQEDAVDRAEIIFMITPSIINDQVISESAERAKALIEGAVTGTREGLLPFSRDKQASRLLVEAQQHAADGNTDKAIYCVRRSLSLSPNQPQARVLLERLSNDVRTWPERSMLQDVFEMELTESTDEITEDIEGDEVDTEVALADGEITESEEAADDGDALQVSTPPLGLTEIPDADEAEGDTTDGDEPADGEDISDEADEAEDGDESDEVASDPTEDATELEDDSLAEADIDPEAAEAEALAADTETLDETELADAREGADGQTESAEEAFEGADWVSQLADSEIESAADALPVEGADAGEQPVEIAEEAMAEAEEPTEGVLFNAEAQTVDVLVSNTDMQDVLRDLGRVSRRNIVADRAVTGNVTATLYDMDFYDALDILTGMNGAGYVEDGKIIYVYTQEQLDTMAAAERAEAEALAAAEAEALAEAARDDESTDPVDQTEGDELASATDTTPAADDAADEATPDLASIFGGEPATDGADEPAETETTTDGGSTLIDEPMTLDDDPTDFGPEGFGEDDFGNGGLGEGGLGNNADAGANGDMPAFSGVFGEDGEVLPEAEPVEREINDAAAKALLGSLSFSTYEWSPSTTRDAFMEPTPWVKEPASIDDADAEALID